ncbi:MAG TPA: PHB depolymerase family esterase [Candidatus Acidoferrales bacterium]|nr:PHB depolymerase family esterase [Candidatus Acidoferrales bacterium]
MKSATLFAACLAVYVATALPARAESAPSAPASTPGNHDESLQLGGLTRTFIVHLPPTFDGKSKMPVVFMLHGAGGSGAGADVETGWCAKSDREGFIVILPDGTLPRPSMPPRFLLNPRIWNDGSGRGAAGKENVDDVGFISAIIDLMEARYGADPDRIYCTGFSNGASMTFSVGVNLSNRVAAIAPVSGHLWLRQRQLAYPVPLLFIIGTEDPLNPIAGGEVKLPWGTQHHPPVEDTLKEWGRMLGCGPQVETALDRNGVKELVYDRCAKTGEVVYYRIDGLGHVWPGGKNRLPEKWVGKPSDKLNATDVIWEFFKAHPRTRPPTTPSPAA